MDKEYFWQIIEASNPAVPMEEQLAIYRRQLERLSTDEMLSFEEIFTKFFFGAYNWDLWLVAYLWESGCSDDSFMDFRFWLISRGKQVYEAALKDADSLAEEMVRSEYPFSEDFGSMLRRVYEEKTGETVPDVGGWHPGEPSGGAWFRREYHNMMAERLLNRCVVFGKLDSDDFALIAKRFPKVWKSCIDKGTVKPS